VRGTARVKCLHARVWPIPSLLTNADLSGRLRVNAWDFGANQNDLLYLALITLRTAVEHRSAFLSRTKNSHLQRERLSIHFNEAECGDSGNASATNISI